MVSEATIKFVCVKLDERAEFIAIGKNACPKVPYFAYRKKEEKEGMEMFDLVVMRINQMTSWKREK